MTRSQRKGGRTSAVMLRPLCFIALLILIAFLPQCDPSEEGRRSPAPADQKSLVTIDDLPEVLVIPGFEDKIILDCMSVDDGDAGLSYDLGKSYPSEDFIDAVVGRLAGRGWRAIDYTPQGECVEGYEPQWERLFQPQVAKEVYGRWWAMGDEVFHVVLSLMNAFEDTDENTVIATLSVFGPPVLDEVRFETLVECSSASP
jgi:hypothetical protein